jgi:membrane-associated phospholipid phosphatase
MRSGLRGPLPALFGCAACVVGVVALMLVAYYDAGAQHLDATALYGFTTLDTGLVHGAVWGFVLIGGVFPLALGLVGLYYLAGRWGRRREAIAATVVVVAANVTTEVLKLALAHPRIQPILSPHQVNAASFPSGHATSAMSMAVAALLVVPPRWRAVTATAGAALVFAVSFSVLVLKWHFPSDVLGGLLVATGYGFAAVAALRYLEARPEERTMARMIPRPTSGTTLEAIAAAAALGAAAFFLLYAEKIIDYAGTYTTTVLTALAISSLAVALLALFSFTAAEY